MTNEHFLAQAPCGPNVTGCAADTSVRSISAPNDHEFIHNIVATVGRPPSFFGEGLAVAYELPTQFEQDMWLPSTRDPREILDEHVGTPLSWPYYVLAGAFTRFLIDRHGLNRFLGFFGEGKRDDTLAQTEALFHSAFGETMEAAIVDFQAQRLSCPMGGFRFKLTECAADTITWDDERMALFRSLECADGNVLGPFEDQTLRWYARFEVRRAGVFRVQAVGDSEGVVTFGACGGCEAGVHEVLFAGEPARLHSLAAGQYHLGLIGRDAAAVVGVGLSLERVGDL